MMLKGKHAVQKKEQPLPARIGKGKGLWRHWQADGRLQDGGGERGRINQGKMTLKHSQKRGPHEPTEIPEPARRNGMSEERTPNPYNDEKKSIEATARSDGKRIQILLAMTKSVPADSIGGQRFGA